MPSEETFYAYLRVRDRRYYGAWKRLQNLILPTRLFRRNPGNFSIPLRHILINDQPNSFGPVYFYQAVRLKISDSKDETQNKTTIHFNANTAEMTDEHLNVLTIALTCHAGCHEVATAKESSLYRL